MYDTRDLLSIMKKASTEAVEAGKPVNILFGKVTSSLPLQINIEQKMTLTDAQLVLTRNVTNYTINLGMNLSTDEVDEHLHSIIGMQKVTIYNSLVVGDEVLLIRMQGGQKYIVLDRVKS